MELQQETKVFLPPERIVMVDITNGLVTTWNQGFQFTATTDEMRVAKEIIINAYLRSMN